MTAAPQGPTQQGCERRAKEGETINDINRRSSDDGGCTHFALFFSCRSRGSVCNTPCTMSRCVYNKLRRQTRKLNFSSSKTVKQHRGRGARAGEVNRATVTCIARAHSLRRDCAVRGIKILLCILFIFLCFFFAFHFLLAFFSHQRAMVPPITVVVRGFVQLSR